MEVTTVSLLRYEGVRNAAFALAQMGLAPGKLATVPGLRFSRLMGSGAGNGFSLAPNWNVYALVAHWSDRAAAAAFFATNDWWVGSAERRSHSLTCWLEATMSHGRWGGQQPFRTDPAAYRPADPVAVITRATIRPHKLIDFWRYVPQTSASVYDHPERLLSIGIGEYPIFMQATFSLWRSGQAMQKFAYRSDHHAEVVKLTRQRGWYAEEMFNRFRILDIEGEWPGLDSSERRRLTTAVQK